MQRVVEQLNTKEKAPLAGPVNVTHLNRLLKKVQQDVNTLLAEASSLQEQVDDLVASSVTDGDKGDITVSGSGLVWEIDPLAVGTPEIADKAVTYAKIQDVAGGNVLGKRGLDGQVEEVAVNTSLVLAAGPAIVREALTGDVTAARNSNTTTIANDAVTYAKMQNVTAESRLIGRGLGAGAGDPEEITLGAGLSMAGTTLSSSGGSGDIVTVNGASASDVDLDDATPAAPAGDLNVKWQKDSSAPDNVSAYVDVSVLEPLLTLGNLAGTLGIAKGGTGQTGATAAFDALAPTTTAGDIIYSNGTDNVRLAIGSAGQLLRTNSGATAPEWASPGQVVYAPTPADTAVNSTSDVTIATVDLASAAAGDQYILDAAFTISNNSGATRVYTITADFDNAFDIEVSTGAMAASATLEHVFFVRACLSIRSTSLAYETVCVQGQLAAGLASGADTTMAATNLNGLGWGTSASNLTGTLTCNLKVRSANATATQTLRLVNFTIRKVVP